MALKIGKHELRMTAMVLLMGFVGCADGPPSAWGERTNELGQGWSVTSCDDPDPHVTVTGDIDPPVPSTAGYNACKKSFIIDLFNYGFSGSSSSGSSFGGSASFDGGLTGGTGGSLSFDGETGGGSASSDGGLSIESSNVTVRWSQTPPGTQTDCNASFVGAIFYRRTWSGTWEDMGNGQNRNYGVWSNGACTFAPVVYEPVEFGHTYRIAATARDALNNIGSLTVRTGDPDLP